MKTFMLTITAFVAVNLMTAGLALAQEDEKALSSASSSGQAVAGPSESSIEPDEVELFATGTGANIRLDSSVGRLLADRLSSRSSSTSMVFVIPAAEIKTEDLITINEDMNVMSRIFGKNLEQARISTARGSIFGSRDDRYSMLLRGGGGEIQSMYLQGYGALFLMKVDFPLSPPPQAREEEETKEEGRDPVWDQTREEIYEPEKVDMRRRTDRPEGKYEAEKVENLKTTLIKALKHAANIRSLKPDESVILTITGRGKATGRKIASARVLPGKNEILVQERTADGKMITKLVQGTSFDVLDDLKLSSPTILVIRTKKSDIDEFAKGALDFDQFRQRTQMLTCPYLGGGGEAGRGYEYPLIGFQR
ncbi:MAG: hypothetical protein PVJ86_07360 [Phycisphaerales bacterium]|jgi:hypothetical protein